MKTEVNLLGVTHDEGKNKLGRSMDGRGRQTGGRLKTKWAGRKQREGDH